ncbi:hypothetical protein D7V86_00725 [bacterium D16-51]|nr:hypothetical protein D7V96_04595 [bacterium D16-59]RKI62757.1 hypothetical protein D7V86_00725 [bacterium D16-51]
MKKKIIKNTLILTMVFALSGAQLNMPLKQVFIPSVAVDAKTPVRKLTWKQAMRKLVKWLKKKKLYNKKYVLSYDGHMEGKKYLFHYYEDMGTHTATVNWYYVHSKTGKITPMFKF